MPFWTEGGKEGKLIFNLSLGRTIGELFLDYFWKLFNLFQQCRNFVQTSRKQQVKQMQ